jgi:hypothetical protein
MKVPQLCFLLLLFVSNHRLKAQIIYTDIPDATPNATYPLDLNNDNVVDFLIQFDLGDKVMCKPQNNNAYAGDFVGGMYLPWALSSFSNICETLPTWYDSINPGTMAWGTNTGNWIGETDKYLALKLIVGPNTYFGWTRLDVEPGSTSFTVKDYAYQSSPNTCIEAGQIILGIDDITAQNIFTVFPNPFVSSTTIKTLGNFKNATLSFYDVFGQTVRQIDNLSGETVTFPRENLLSGFYFISLEEDKKIIQVEKLMIID